MSVLRFARSIALIAFALSMIGGKSCFDSYGDSWATKISQPPEQKPFCMTDPPYLCAAVCNAPGLEGTWIFSDECSGISADAMGRTTLFKAAAMQVYCDAEGELTLLTPSDVDVPSVQIESSDACTPAPPW